MEHLNKLIYTYIDSLNEKSSLWNTIQSLAIAEMKKVNAAKLEMARAEELKAQGLDPGPPKLQVRNHF